jgi:hypothetical protein
MTIRLAAILSCVLLLTGCSTVSSYWDMFNFSDSANEDDAMREQQAAAAPARPATPAITPGTPDPFCVAVARQESGAETFDTATQQRMALRSYQQCVAMYRSQQ